MELVGFGFEECRVSRGARKVVEVFPGSEVDGISGKLEVEEVASSVAVPCPPSLTRGDLVLVFEILVASTRVSSVSLSSCPRSLSRVEPDFGVGGMSGYSIGLAAAVTVVPQPDEWWQTGDEDGDEARQTRKMGRK